jgi:response regulator RpfG family c-di-GMP phosphodiesterase
MNRAEAAPRMIANRPTILVVDDEPDVLRSVYDLFRLDYRVLTFERAVDALEALRTLDDVSVILSDQRMPGMNGVEFLEKARQIHPIATRLLVTGYADIKAVIDAINQGNVFRYITKPWDPEELIEALREAGARYDHLVHRNQLLSDLRGYESRCITFADDVLEGRRGSLKLEAIDEAKALIEEGRGLITRLDAALVTSLNEPAR